MPAVNFTMFREEILSGKKLHTIRRIRERPIQVGDHLILYWMQRTSDCKKLMDARCTAIQTFAMDQRGTMFVDGDPLNNWQAEELAIADGFKNANEMREFFRGHYGDILSGMVIIHWS